MFTLSVQAQYSSTMLAESTRGYLSVNTPVLCIQSRSEFRCGASTRSRPCTTTTARFSVGTDVNSTACMRTSLVSKYVSVYWQSIFFLSAKWSNCVHYIWTISDIRFWKKRNFVTFVPVLWQLCLAIVFGHCTECKTSLSVCYFWNMKYYLYSKDDNMKYFVRGWLMSCWYLPLKQEARSFCKLYVSKSIRGTYF